MTRSPVRSAVVIAVALSVAPLVAGPATASVPAKKKPTPCTLVTAAQIESIVDLPVTGPNKAGAGGFACDFDIGPGLGEPGGGIAIVQYYTGTLAKAIWRAAKSGEGAEFAPEKVGKFYWSSEGEIASGYKKGRMVAASISYTGSGDAPEAAEVQPQSLALLKAALKKA